MNSIKAYGMGEDLIKVTPKPIISTRNPGLTDKAQLSTVWINKSERTAYMMTKVGGGFHEWAILSVGALESIDTNTTIQKVDKRVFSVEFHDLAIANSATEQLTIFNEFATLNAPMQLSVTTSGTGADGVKVVSKSQPASGEIDVIVSNSSGAVFNGSIVITGKILS